MWLNLYDFGSDSYELIEKMRDTYYLVAIIDNDFTSCGKDGSKFLLLDSLLEVGKMSSSHVNSVSNTQRSNTHQR
jgi:hypothetical protein